MKLIRKQSSVFVPFARKQICIDSPVLSLTNPIFRPRFCKVIFLTGLYQHFRQTLTKSTKWIYEKMTNNNSHPPSASTNKPTKGGKGWTYQFTPLPGFAYMLCQFCLQIWRLWIYKSKPEIVFAQKQSIIAPGAFESWLGTVFSKSEPFSLTQFRSTTSLRAFIWTAVTAVFPRIHRARFSRPRSDMFKREDKHGKIYASTRNEFSLISDCIWEFIKLSRLDFKRHFLKTWAKKKRIKIDTKQVETWLNIALLP